MRILGALLAFAIIAHCRDPSAPPQPTPDPGPTDGLVVADHKAELKEPVIEPKPPVLKPAEPAVIETVRL